MTNYARIPSAFSGPLDQKHHPVLFQVLSPDMETVLLPTFLYLHVNPTSFDLSYAKNIVRIQTEGGFVEQHFDDQLVDISASGSSGAFVSVERGITTFDRRNTIAYRKMQHLIDIFKSNGSVYDDHGQIQFQGRIRLVFSGGMYDGYFRSLSISETAEAPFYLNISWSFKVVREALNLVY